MIYSTLFTALSLFVSLCYSMPSPWTRELYLTSPALTGNDVIIAQNLLMRCPAVVAFQANGVFEESSKEATFQFQQYNKLSPTGIFDDATANLLLQLHSADGNFFSSLSFLPPLSLCFSFLLLTHFVSQESKILDLLLLLWVIFTRLSFQFTTTEALNPLQHFMMLTTTF